MAEIDYRALLKKYMNLIRQQEGIYYVNWLYEGEYELSKDEIAELQRLSKECENVKITESIIGPRNDYEKHSH